VIEDVSQNAMIEIDTIRNDRKGLSAEIAELKKAVRDCQQPLQMSKDEKNVVR
jgi:hypothetical protein